MHRAFALTAALVLVSIALTHSASAALITQPAAPSIYAVDIVSDSTFQPRVYASCHQYIGQDVPIAGVPDCCRNSAKAEASIGSDFWFLSAV